MLPPLQGGPDYILGGSVGEHHPPSLNLWTSAVGTRPVRLWLQVIHFTPRWGAHAGQYYRARGLSPAAVVTQSF